jgi:ABC-type sugar transport system substrate-binding protein
MTRRPLSIARTALVVAALTALIAALAAVVFARPGRAAHRTYTIAYVTGGTNTQPIQALARGSRAAARALGVRYVLAGTVPNGAAQDLIPTYEAMIARHVDAIVSQGYQPPLKPILTKVRKDGILLVSSGDDIAAERDVWVSQTGNVAYGEALADALASQIQGRGEYAIIEEQGQYPVAVAWAKVVAAYVRKAYPKMKLDAVISGSGVGDQTEVDWVKKFMSSHPRLRGLVAVVPTEAWMAAEAITQTHKIGKVFSSGNGDDSFGDPLPGWVRSGAGEFVYVSDPVKLGYLTVWAANYLLTGHHFKWGAYQVGGPIGLVRYYANHRELRLGQPLTITKANVDLYANKF